MPTDPNIHPHWAAETKNLAQQLDQLDYYQLLGCDHDAPLAEIKSQYHALQRAYHPDTFFQSPDVELKTAVMKIAKRVAEAYVILRDLPRREKYNRDLAGPDSNVRRRFADASEGEFRQEQEEMYGRTAQGRTLVQKALASYERGDLAGAERDFKTALLFEPGNEGLRRRLEILRQEIASLSG